jgi:hypothetical protein
MPIPRHRPPYGTNPSQAMGMLVLTNVLKMPMTKTPGLEIFCLVFFFMSYQN